MPRPITQKQLHKARMAIGTVAILLLVPIAAYVATFGTSISNEHTRWSEMGSAMAGIYAPILALLTLVVLFVQVLLQGRLNEHTFDQSHVQDARADLHFYLDQLGQEVTRMFTRDGDLQSFLVSTFAHVSFKELQQPELVAAAKEVNRRTHRLVAVWSAVYAILAGLKANDYPPYSSNYATAKQKAIAVLSFECCAALDNLLWSVSDGRLAFRYEFSSILPSE